MNRSKGQMVRKDIAIDLVDVVLHGDLVIPDPANGLVLFSHGSGSSRKSPRNRRVAGALHDAGTGTLLLDLLTEEEDDIRDLRFDIDLLTERLIAATTWATRQEGAGVLPIGLFGASTGAASALRAAAELPEIVKAVVSRGGRPDLAMGSLDRVRAPTLLIVGGLDGPVIDMNRQALAALQCIKRLTIIEGATHLFEGSGKLDEVARLAVGWFKQHLR